jgi:hypothetical protein
MPLKEAIFWLWRVRTLSVRVRILVIGEDEHGDPVTDIDVDKIYSLTIPLGDGVIGSRTEYDQLLDRRAYIIDEPVDDHGTQVTLGFAGALVRRTPEQWYIGLGLEVRSSGTPIIKYLDPLLPASPFTIEISGNDPIEGEVWEHSLPVRGALGTSGFVTIEPAVYQEGRLWTGGPPLYNPSTGNYL